MDKEVKKNWQLQIVLYYNLRPKKLSTGFLSQPRLKRFCYNKEAPKYTALFRFGKLGRAYKGEIK